MSLQFIFGNSGSGKSRFLYQRMIEESRLHPERSYLVIVPEQFTMQTQRDLVLLHPDGGIMNIDVLSFRRLAHRVFEEVGADRRTILTETGKNLMLRRVAEQQKDQLKVLGSRMNRTGYVSEVKSILSELMQYEVSDYDLQCMLESVENRPLLHAKLEDVRVLYRAFLEYQRDRFMKPEELLEVLAQVAGKSKLLRQSVLAFDGYAGFTPSQLSVLEKLLVVCPKIYLTVTIDARESFFGKIREHELFAPSRRLIKSVAERCEKTMRMGKGENRSHQETSDTRDGEMRGYEEPIVLGTLPRFSRDGALRHLEQNLFRKKQLPYEGESDEISLHELSSPAQEVHFAARTISHLVREGQYRYREIAVIAGDLNAYGDYVKNIFPSYGIPAFVDETRGILLNPCLEFVRGALAMVRDDFSRESVFRFLRTGLAGLSSDEADRLENYVIAAGIRGYRRWEEEWTWCPEGLRTVTGLGENMQVPEASGEEIHLAGLELYNALRARFIDRVGSFTEEMRVKNRPLRAYAQALYHLLADCNVQQQMKNLENQAGELSSEYRQVYPVLIGLLDEMVDLLGEERMDCGEFSEILDAGLSEARIGIIPPGIDQVQVGDIRRSRLSNVKILFFLGLNDGWVPARPDGGGIVSDTEREILLNAGASLAPSARENSYIQRFYLYQNLTKPQDRLYLSWCLSSGDGTAMRPSYLVSVLRRLFPKMQTQREQDAGTMFSQVTSKENGMLYLLHGLQKVRNSAAAAPGQTETCRRESIQNQREMQDFGRNQGEQSDAQETHTEQSAWLELYRLYLKDDAYRERVRTLVGAAFLRGKVPDTEHLEAQTARELYGMFRQGGASGGISASVTRLELFAGCAFSHFASYGLRLRSREEYGLQATDLGTLFHEAIEFFSRQMLAEGFDPGERPYEEQARRMDQCVDMAAERYGDGILHANARDEYTIRRLKRILRRTVWVMREQTRAGRFRPVGFEISFADTDNLDATRVRLGENGQIRLQGRIDRIDTAETEDTVYVKVVDYKSGMTQFDPVSLYYGLQMQLIVYLNAALEMERKLHPDKKVVPAGVFYHRMQDPVLEKEEDPERARETLLKKMRPNGLVNSDGPVIRLFDGAMSGDSLVIPVGFKKDGTLKATSSVVTTEQFEALSGYVTELLCRMGGEILDGMIEARPYVDKNRSACDYCLYADVCGFDRKLPGRCEKRQPQLTADEVIERLPNAKRSENGRRDLPPVLPASGRRLAPTEARAENEGEGAIPERLSTGDSLRKEVTTHGSEVDEGTAAGD
ncbi:MAG: exodeoxyribonuclease V subunit gamma [Lachnospiraceae bacterium]|nr:exodeoxyribonuclease V subunit gamma [Lachnospiraceae bacterium]